MPVAWGGERFSRDFRALKNLVQIDSRWNLYRKVFQRWHFLGVHNLSIWEYLRNSFKNNALKHFVDQLYPSQSI